MGGRRIFIKNIRDTTFNKDLSNEPNFCQIHLSGQYLKGSMSWFQRKGFQNVSDGYK